MGNTLNKVELIGYLAEDPFLKQTQAGKTIVHLVLATTQEWKLETGEKKQKVDYHKVVIFGTFAETCNKTLKKGDKIFVEGILQNSTWEALDGTKRFKTEVISKNMIFLYLHGEAQAVPSIIANAEIEEESNENIF